jgi:hypothetical protein
MRRVVAEHIAQDQPIREYFGNPDEQE